MPEVRFILHVPASDEYLLHADTAVYRYSPSGTAPPPADARRPAAPDATPETVRAETTPAPACPPFEDLVSLLEPPGATAPPYRVDSQGNVEPDAGDDASDAGGK